MSLPSLLLERIGLTRDFNVNVREADELTTAALLTLLNDGLVIGENLGLGWEGYDITDRGSDARSGLALDLLVVFPGASTSSGDVALWVWLLLHGGVVPQYGISPELSTEVLHLLVCGLDLARSDSVRDDVWYIWGGSFADDERRAGVSGSATCRCGEVSELQLVAEVSSVTKLLRQMLDR